MRQIVLDILGFRPELEHSWLGLVILESCHSYERTGGANATSAKPPNSKSVLVGPCVLTVSTHFGSLLGLFGLTCCLLCGGVCVPRYNKRWAGQQKRETIVGAEHAHMHAHAHAYARPPARS